MHGLKGLSPFLTLDSCEIDDGINTIEQPGVGATRVETGSSRKDTRGPSGSFERRYHVSAEKSCATNNGSSPHIEHSLLRRWRFMPSACPSTG
jgi:hypothetical protein